MAKLYAMLYIPMSLEDDCDGVTSVSINALSDDPNKLMESALATMNEERDLGDEQVMSVINDGDGDYRLKFKGKDEPDTPDAWLTYFTISQVEII